MNKLIVLGRKLVDGKTQTPEEEQEITITITMLSKKMVEVERSVELQKIRLNLVFTTVCEVFH